MKFIHEMVRLLETRTPDLYRVKAALLYTANILRGVEGCLKTCKYA
jgi:hypothetical protein